MIYNQRLLKRYGTHILYPHILIGEKGERDGIADIFRYVEKTGDLQKTTAVTEQEYRQFFET